jgi:hypothetical protein
MKEREMSGVKSKMAQRNKFPVKPHWKFSSYVQTLLVLF